MAAGYNWAAGAFTSTAWQTNAWRTLAALFDVALERVHTLLTSNRVQTLLANVRIHIVPKSDRTQKVTQHVH